MTITIVEFLYRAELDRATLDVWIEQEWLIPQTSESEPSFTEADLARARLIRELMDDMGVNEEGVGVILNLLDQIHSLRRLLAQTLDKTPGEGADAPAELETDNKHGQ